jgi:hypothetical protein
VTSGVSVSVGGRVEHVNDALCRGLGGLELGEDGGEAPDRLEHHVAELMKNFS